MNILVIEVIDYEIIIVVDDDAHTCLLLLDITLSAVYTIVAEAVGRTTLYLLFSDITSSGSDDIDRYDW